MTTADLIDTLSSRVAPVRPGQTARLMAGAILAGGAVALAAVVAAFGVQPGLGTFEHGAPFAMKATYASLLAAAAFGLAVALVRPGAEVPVAWPRVGLPVAALAGLALLQLARAPSGDWPALLLGSSWDACPWRIVLLSIPVFAGLCVAVRRQAPTDLRRAGAAVGLMSGASAAVLYALACTESSAAFVLVWYTAGIALTTLAGWLAGPRLLRW